MAETAQAFADRLTARFEGSLVVVAQPRGEVTIDVAADQWLATAFALRDEFGNAYRHGSGRFIARCSRRSRTRMRCGDVSWFAGDLSWAGWATIWYERDDGGVTWNYAFKIKRTNWYCLDRKRQRDPAYKGKRCSKVYRVR